MGDKVDRYILLGPILMHTPYILFDSGDVSLFRSLEALGAYVESPDIDGYLATDCGGRIVRLASSTSDARTKGPGLIVPVGPVTASLSEERLEPDEMRSRLIRFLQAVSAQPDQSMSLAHLVVLLEQTIGYTA